MGGGVGGGWFREGFRDWFLGSGGVLFDEGVMRAER